MTREISEKIKLFGLLMTCAIVCYHCPTVDAPAAGLDRTVSIFLGQSLGILGTLAMSHFFSVTGYLLFQNYTLRDYPEKMKRRVQSLLIPYVLWQGITVVLKLVTGDVVTLGDFIRKTFLFARYPYNGALWYVYVVFCLALLSPVLLALFRNRTLGWCSVLALTVLSAARGMVTLPVVSAVLNYGYLDNTFVYLPCFLAGCFYGKFHPEAEGIKGLKYLLCGLLLALVLEGFLPGIFRDMILKLLPLMALFTLPVKAGAFLKKFYPIVFLVYAVHQPLIGILWAILSRIYRVVPLPATVANLLTQTVVLGTATIAAAMIRLVLSRVCPKLLGALTGGRV